MAGDADPSSGYQIRVDGRDAVFGGTSAVAPLWAALIALVNQRRGRHFAFMHPLLYLVGARGRRDITAGNDGTGWDACTGHGSPKGTALATLLASKAAAV